MTQIIVKVKMKMKMKMLYRKHGKLLVTHGGTAKVINSYFEWIGENGILPRVGMRKL